MKKSVSTILALVGSLLIIAFLSWAFSLHGTIGLYRVNGVFHWFVLLLGFVAGVLILLAFSIHWLKTRGKSRGLRWLSVVTILVSLPAIIIPSVGFSVTSGVFSPGIGYTPPQILVADGTGAYGVPDMAVVFNTKTATKNTLTWGQQDTTIIVKEDTPSKQHVFMLSNLQPNSTYIYQVNSDPIISFTTPEVGGSIHLAVASDAHFGAGDARNDFTAEMLGDIANPANDFDMFFFLGDLVEYGFQKNQWQQAFQALSPMTLTIPTRFAVGNHDTLFSGFNNYQNYCYPEEMDVQTGSQLWHRIDIGNVHFLVLDVEWSAESFTAVQAAWLETQLMNIPADDWKIVMSHGFYYASGVKSNGWKWYDNSETIEQLTPLFTKYKVDLVLSGHDHRLELLQNSGIVYAICGAFGGLPDPASTYTSPSSIWEKNGEYGFIDATISGDQCTLIFRNFNYQVLKTYTFNKN